MRIYTVHAPRTADADIRAIGDRVVFVRDGIHVWAFVFGGLWLLYHRLWWALVGYVVLMTGVSIALGFSRVGTGVSLCVLLLLALLMGLEAASLRRWTLSRGKWRQLDIVVATDEQDAERRFFERWAARERDLAEDSMTVERGSPPPTRNVPGQSFSRPPASPGIVGLFPQPGGST
ncbi:MAG TPA: DUF2628 domain-containing protein [Xanthobacteraceae bacterium]|nr:DUF2628 domain-containing protein [Xanthobacteraceae bacterium]